MWDFWRVRPKKRQVKIKKGRGVLVSQDNWQKRLLFTLANLVWLGAVTALVYLYYPLAQAMINYKKIDQAEAEQEVVAIVEKPEPIIEEINYFDFWLEIPKIGAKSQVVPGVSPYNKEKYLPVLANNLVAQAMGSGFPGQDQSIYLFAHSTFQNWNMGRKNAVFYLLGQLEANDAIVVKFSGKDYVYRVYDKQVTDKKEADWVEYQTTEETLILQTCWPPGTNWQRLVVLAKKDGTNAL